MKLLLTSGGITNGTIKNALADLIGKPFSETSLAFIPTAADVEDHDKSWLVNDLNNCKNLGLKLLDIVDISALSKEQWEPRLQSADILFFGGGNTFHLMYWINKSGLAKKLPGLLKTKVYVGLSAGSMVAGKTISLSDSKKLYYEDIKGYQGEKVLGFVDFQIRPHLNSPHFPDVQEKKLRKLAKNAKEKVYAIDDNMAIKVVDCKVEVVGEGKYLILNSK
ncbi:MAG: peptidase E [Candidatus Curtissbacteria bacterium]|nr:peptidase E [Candidatus Curtissbacteria bacterium]